MGTNNQPVGGLREGQRLREGSFLKDSRIKIELFQGYTLESI